MNTDYKFGDPIWFSPDGRCNIEAIYVCKGFGCATIVTQSSINMTVKVGFDTIRHRENKTDSKGQWIPFPDHQPKCDTPLIVSIRDDSGDSTRHYTDVGWRSSSFLRDNAWIVGNEVNYNVEAWMFMPRPYDANEEYKEENNNE